FVYEPAILLQGDPLYAAFVIAQAVLGVIVLASALHGYLLTELTRWQKAVLLLATFGLIYPDWRASLPALALVALVIVRQRAARPISEGVT
ncbi:MAG: DUF3394 domain-containing protein, partial [Hyphomicrobiales bacterium]|nr:DUF3394 domain-containing protein [Hyphomicrobiales bacterium]